MDSPGRRAGADAADALAVFDGLDDPHAPLTAGEVAEALDCSRSSARRSLEALTVDGSLKSRETDAGGRLWWRSDGGEHRPAEVDAENERAEEFRALVEAVENYAIFILDTDGTVRTWNPGAEHLKGYAEEEIVGEHFSAFYTGEDREAGVPERNLETAAQDGRVEDEGWRVREDGTRFWANVTITALQDDDGLRGFAKITRDMTERHEREEELRRERDLTEQFRLLIDSVREYAIFMMDVEGHVQSWNPGAEQIKGYAEEEIVGEHFSTFYTAEDREAGVPERNLEMAAERGHAEDEGWRLREDGSRFWANVTITAVEDDEGELRGFAKVTRDMTERKRREDQLAALNEVARQLMEAKTGGDIAEIAIDAAEADLELPATSIVYYDEDRGELRAEGRTADADRLPDEAALFDPRSDAVWDVFSDQEPRVETDIGGSAGVESGIALPLGRHGVFVTGFEAAQEPGETVLEFAKLVAADLEAALNHVERRQLLIEREASLEEQNERLERTNRINGVIRAIDRSLVDATSREEIEQAVCDRLATGDAYRFAWISRHHSAGEALDPVAWSGGGQERVDGLATATGGDSPNRQPAEIAAGTREPHAVATIGSDPPFEPWRKEALKRGYRSCLAVPLLYEDSLYGVLTVFADRPDAFAGVERRVLEELGDTIAHAINALESKRALVSDEVVELEFHVGDPSVPVLGLVDEADCAFEFENVVTRADGSYRSYFVTRDASPEDVRAFADESPAIEDLRLVAEDGEECLFECTLLPESLAAILLDHGAVPRSITAADGLARLVVTVARDADVREFAEMLAAKYPESELTARRTHERAARTHHTFKADFESRLTERQRETLQTAYFSGFFDTPRKRTGQEIGETLGVSQPTVNHHLRAAQRKLFGMLYDEEAPGGSADTPGSRNSR